MTEAPRGFVYAATGSAYVTLARRSARALRRIIGPDAQIDLFTDAPVHDPVFSQVHILQQASRRPKIEALLQIAGYAAQGFKTIINARGKSDTGYYFLEKEACEQHGITLIDLRLRSREPPSIEAILRCKQIFETINYPALMHCKSGADRAGVGCFPDQIQFI